MSETARLSYCSTKRMSAEIVVEVGEIEANELLRFLSREAGSGWMSTQLLQQAVSESSGRGVRLPVWALPVIAADIETCIGRLEVAIEFAALSGAHKIRKDACDRFNAAMSFVKWLHPSKKRSVALEKTHLSTYSSSVVARFLSDNVGHVDLDAMMSEEIRKRDSCGPSAISLAGLSDLDINDDDVTINFLKIIASAEARRIDCGKRVDLCGIFKRAAHTRPRTRE